jgi:2-polyprenyl-3-methyl-5-hydroxy-6-metoxy-1,4-benzoquinol methylase
VHIKNQIKPFYKLLSSLNLDEVEMEGYTKDYLQYIIKQKTYHLEIYAFILEKTIETANLSLENTMLLDFGAGNGLLAFFAKFCGVKKVEVCDIRPEFIHAIKQLSDKLKITIDGFILGNENEVLKHYTTSSEKPNICIGTDVIEHVYRVDFLLKAMKIVNPNIVIAFSTASVYDNMIKRYQLYQIMHKDEYEGYDLKGDYEGGSIYAGKAFLEVRKQLIVQKAPELKQKEINDLAIATRGLNKKDIETCVEQYLINQQMPNPPKNKYNTCNPITACYTEQMLTQFQYKKLYFQNGFKLTSYNGFYNVHHLLLKRILLKIINLLPKLFKTSYLGRFVAPFVVLIGKPTT